MRHHHNHNKMHHRKHNKDYINRAMHRMHRPHAYFVREEFKRYHRYVRFSHLIFLVFNITIFYFAVIYFKIKLPIYILIMFLGIIMVKEIAPLIYSRKMSHKIMMPIERLKKAVDEVSEGNYGVVVKQYPNNEIGELIEAFNQMSLKLKESEELKMKYEENRKTLIANISHDLKTPITSIVGYVEGIQEGVANSPEKLDKYIDIIYHNASYTNRLIDDLFLFSKLDIQQVEFEFVETPMKAYMNDLMTEQKIELEENGHKIEYLDALAEEKKLTIDRKRIHQVIINIINNAIKYNDKDKSTIKCTLSEVDKGVKISINDNGPGIEDEKLDSIFHRFYRVDESRNKDIGGTGLGLAIAKELVKAHSGKIWCESTLGEGTTIHFTILDEKVN
ncbi:HAMP domain-containing sensor histidine kinase [Wukongibacter baidiensis]|uniref:sensor histidine kinase n=1 Tax=Wukongibacter baidiensis TaxID=1723361 RepID=UPI003D7FF381